MCVNVTFSIFDVYACMFRSSFAVDTSKPMTVVTQVGRGEVVVRGRGAKW